MTSDPVAVAVVRSFGRSFVRSTHRPVDRATARSRTGVPASDRVERFVVVARVSIGVVVVVVVRSRARARSRARVGVFVYYVCREEIGVKRRVLCNWSPMDFLSLYLERRSHSYREYVWCIVWTR